jgi:hypothetical protein
MKAKAWKVWLEVADGRVIHVDTVFFDATMPSDEVKRALVNHDSYNPNIILEESK